VFGARLRQYAERFEHRLGLAWADACDALTVWLEGDPARGAQLMRSAAEALEAIPFVPDATRLRRQLAGRLAETGDREGALRELRHVHDMLARLGAEQELERTRNQFRELDARPPARASTPGAVGLTGRELEIARAIARHKSNKAIGAELKISVRTVTTHVSNIFRKLEVGSRREVAEAIRAAELAGEIGPR
jgi:DNA-binding CsgD family transcriptional regulator